MHEIVNGVEIPWPRRVAKARARRRNHFATPAEKFEVGRCGIDGLEAVQQQDWATGAAPHSFEFYPAYRQQLPTRHHILPSAKPKRQMYSLEPW